MPTNNKSNNVLIQIIVPLAKKLRVQNPQLSQKEAIRIASQIYRNEKNKGNGLFDTFIKSIPRNIEDTAVGSSKIFQQYLGKL